LPIRKGLGFEFHVAGNEAENRLSRFSGCSMAKNSTSSPEARWSAGDVLHVGLRPRRGVEELVDGRMRTVTLGSGPGRAGMSAMVRAAPEGRLKPA